MSKKVNMKQRVSPDNQWHEKEDRILPGYQSEYVNETGSPACAPPSGRNNIKTDWNQPRRLHDRPVPGLSHDVLKSYLIGQQKTSQFLIGQNPESSISQIDLIGQLQNESNNECNCLESQKEQLLTEKDSEVLNFENLIIKSDSNKITNASEEISDGHDVLPASTDTAVNNSHPSQATCEGNLSSDQLGDKNVNKQGGRGEKFYLETITAVKGDTVINNNPCSYSNLSLTNKPVSELNVKSKCLLFGHAKHSVGEDKFSTPGCKLNNEITNTATALQHRSSTLEFYTDKTFRNCNKPFEVPGLLKHEQSDLSSFYTAHSEFGSDFYGFSASSFVTCQEFLTLGPKSRFTKAKDVLLKGRNYVKAKLTNYQKRLRSSASAGNRKCGSSCGFPCFFLGREVSQFSFGIPECSLVKEHNHSYTEGKGDNSNSNNDLSGADEEFFTSDSITMSENHDFLENHVTNQVKNEENVEDLQNGPNSNFKGGCGKGGTVSGQTTDNIMTVKLKTEPSPGTSVDRQPGEVAEATESSVDREPGQFTMATDEGQDDLPVGTEAGTITTDQRDSILRSENDSDQKPTNKRLRWVSAMDKTQSSSLHSSTTSNSSVEQYLFEREMDPEKMLKNLGFGFSPDTDISCGRIPDRFLLGDSSASGIDLYKFVLHHPDLHHLLWMWDKKTEAQSTSGPSNQSTGRKSVKVMMRRRTSLPYMYYNERRLATRRYSLPQQLYYEDYEDFDDRIPYSWGRSSTSFASLLHGMKFIQSTQSEVESNRPKSTDTSNSNVKDIADINSVLDLPNRAYLASQGYYGADYVDKDKIDQGKDKEESKGTPKPASAAQRRKQFLQSSKSKNWSLTSEPDDDVSFTESSSGSIDHGLILRSFSEGLSISSESSLEGGDSFNEEDRRNSISNLRRQYQETIRQSIDGEFPVFNASNKLPTSPDTEFEKDKVETLSDRRKREVDRLMASLEDDGDYFAQSRQSSIKEVELVKKRGQPSKDSTLTSPLTPKTLNFSFEKGDEHQFQFSTPISPADLKHKQEISIIVEDETDSETSETSDIDTDVEGEIIKDVKTNTLGLSPLALMKVRSDSSHTLVSQDSNLDTDSLGGDLTPDLEERSRSSTQVSMTTAEPDLQGDQLKPTLIHPPQESFELEEILSADNGVDEISSYTRPSGRRGMIEKSASTHSDSSGFADLESAGEATHSNLDLQQDNLMLDAARLGTSAKYRHHDKNMTVPPLNLYDNRNTHDALHPLPVSKRKQMDSRVKLNQNSVIRNDRNKNFHVCSVRQKLSPSDTDCPSLTSITYRTTDSEPDNKSLVYTISVPYKGKSSRSLSDLSSRSAGQGQRILPKRKFVSTMNVDITVQNSKNGAKNYNAFSCKGPTNYQELDLDPCDPLSCDSEFGRTKDNHMTFHELSDLNNFQKQSAKNRHEVLHTYDGDLDLLHSNRSRSDFTQNGASLRHKLYHEKKSKEALASAKRQMVDWLLSNQRLNSEMQNSESAKQYGHQLSMSTPSLKVKQFSNKHLLSNQDCLERRSFDSQELLKEGRQSVLGRHSKYVRKSFDSQDILNADSRDSPMSSHEFFHYKPQGHFPEDFRCDDSVVSGEECVGPQKRVSLIEGSLGTSEDHLEYLKLARLVNGPSNLMVSGVPKMPAVNYRPTIPLQHWTDLKKTKHLEEETRLMQHAVQRYKTELTVMETMLFNTCQLATPELSDEERADLEELQCLWAEVRKELNKLEEHLSYRLSSVLSGNDNFSPLSAMEIVSSMIDLLREQLYQQQLCISRDISYDNDDLLVQSPDSSVKSVSTSEPALAEFSQQISDIRDTIMRTQLQQQKDLSKSFSDLKDALMAEVHSEMNSNTKWLQLQLQSKDNEIQRLRTEMFLQNLHTGTTRKRQYYESDV